jgi:23S rRNA (cytosine1962-C5)-methyltransferase
MAQHNPSKPAVAHLKYASYGPFIFKRMLDHVDGSPADGDLVAVIDKHGKPFGTAYYNSRSQFALRMVAFGPGDPDESILERRIARAVELRRGLLNLDARTDACRLVHSEGDGLSGLIADRFGEHVVIELFSKAMFLRLKRIEQAMVASGVKARQFIHRVDDEIAHAEGFRLTGGAGSQSPVTITENAVRFEVDLAGGHKTGFFCDQRDNRLALTEFTPGRSVLDVCCYTGGFSCYAASAGQASDVTGVDIDEPALEMAKRNVWLNRAGAKVGLKQSDAFEFLRNAQRGGRSWDIVILDPPKFVPNRDEMERGMRKYRDLNLLAAPLVKPGGILLTCSCSGLVSQDLFVETLARAARAAGRAAQVFRVTGAGADHPVMADAPESGYLKAVWARIE